MSTNLSRYVDSPVDSQLSSPAIQTLGLCSGDYWEAVCCVFKILQMLMPLLPLSLHPFLFPFIFSSSPPFSPCLLSCSSSKITQLYNPVLPNFCPCLLYFCLHTSFLNPLRNESRCHSDKIYVEILNGGTHCNIN